MNLWEGQLANLTWALEHGRILQTLPSSSSACLWDVRDYFFIANKTNSTGSKALGISLICFFPLYGLNNMLPEFITRNAIRVPLQLIISSLSNLSFMVLLVSGLLITFIASKTADF